MMSPGCPSFGLETMHFEAKACATNWDVQLERCGCLLGRKGVRKYFIELHYVGCSVSEAILETKSPDILSSVASI